MTHTEIIKKLIGKIEPYGSSDIDEDRLKNLEVMCDMLHDLITEIKSIAADNIHRQEHSMRLIGKRAQQFIIELTEDLK